MNRVVFCICHSFLAFMGGGLLQGAVFAAPKLVCPEATHEYGRVVNSQEVRHSFMIRNDGDRELRIERIYPGCGCSQARASISNLLPGATGQVDVTVSLAGRMGPQKVNIYLHSNDPQNPIVPLRLTGSTYFPENQTSERGGDLILSERGSNLLLGIMAEPAFPTGSEIGKGGAAKWSITPEILEWAPVASGVYPARSVMIRLSRPEAFKIIGLDSCLPEGTVTVQQQGPGWVQLRVGPIGAGAFQDGMIHLVTDQRESPTVDIPVRIRASP